MRNEILGQQFEQERALYHLTKADVLDCVFAGPADGESVLKEARDIRVENCSFSLRYPLWHVDTFRLHDSQLDELSRAPIWYASNGVITDTDIHSIKAIRECRRIKLSGCSIVSEEFGWKCQEITLTDSHIQGQYLFLDSRDVVLDQVQMAGKYSFQYMENLTIRNSVLDTKDAFWHSKNVTVENSVVKGEYLGWFSEGLTLINCQIIGTQPLCYCKNLRLENCTMEGCDLAFEYSDVEAEVAGHIHSVKNPRSGRITADSVGQVIWEDAIMPCAGQVVLRQEN